MEKTSAGRKIVEMVKVTQIIATLRESVPMDVIER